MESASDTKRIPRYFPTSTPIVDGFEPLPSRSRLRLGTGEYFFLSGVLILGLMGLPILRRTTEALSGLGIISAALILCLLIPSAGLAAAVFVHEAGHLVAAHLAGFHLASRRVSALSAGSREAWSLCFRGLLRVGAWNLEPRTPDHVSRRLLFAVLGGSIASFTVPLMLAAFVALTGSKGSNPLGVFCIEVCGALCVLIGIAELLPDMGRGASSDGARLLMLFRNDALAGRWLSLARLQLAWNGDQWLRSWDDTAISEAIAVDDESRDAVAARWIAYWWASERQDITSAAKYLEESLAVPAASSDWLRDRLFLEAAIFQAWFREDPERAAMWAARIRSSTLTAQQDCRLDIALLWADGRLFEAWEKLRESIARFQPNLPAEGYVQINWQEWKKQMESRMLTRAWRALYSTTQVVDGATPQPDQSPTPEPASLPN